MKNILKKKLTMQMSREYYLHFFEGDLPERWEKAARKAKKSLLRGDQTFFCYVLLSKSRMAKCKT